jgi:hypothetical protein
MIPRHPTRREVRIPRSPRWILIGAIVLAPVVATVDFVSLSASARSATVAFSERIASEGWTGSRPAAVTERPQTKGMQWAFLRDIGAKAASLMHVQTAISAPSVVGPTGTLHR